jgi:hypothetical protein
MNSVAGIGRARASRQCNVIYCTRSGAKHDSISKKTSVVETGNAEMTLECEHTCVTNLFPKRRKPSRDLSQVNESLLLTVRFRLSLIKSISI